MSTEGLVYTARNGMTLYTLSIDGKGKSACTNKEMKTGSYEAAQLVFPLPYKPGERRSCVQKWPPLEAEAAAKPVGPWSIIERPDKARQWAYQERPVYTSIEDKRPGQIAVPLKSFWGDIGKPLIAPLDAPDNIHLVKTDTGTAWASSGGEVLFALDRDRKNQSRCSGDCLLTWKPVIASAGISGHDDWSLAARNLEGVKQWTYRGRPLYTYIGTGDKKAAVNGDARDRGRMATLYLAPKAPANLAVTMGPRGPIFTDDKGMTIYSFVCSEPSEDRLSCDRPGDTAGYYFSLCGGPAKCGDIFKFVEAPLKAQENDVWTVRRIDPGNPMRVLNRDERGKRVWAYYGRPVFRYAGDTEPGDIYGLGVRAIVFGGLETIPAALEDTVGG